MLTWQPILLFVLLILSGFFSGVETALMSMNSIKVKTLLNQKKVGAKALYRVKQNPQKMMVTLLIANNIVNIGAATLATVVFTDLFGSSGLGIAMGVMTFLILVFGEITPKTFAAQNSEKVALIVAKPIEILEILLFPVVKFFEGIAFIISKILGGKGEEYILSEDEIRTVVTLGRQQGILREQAAGMMHNLLTFHEVTVAELMTPKKEVATLQSTDKLKDIIDFVVKKKYTRYPVYVSGKLTSLVNIDDILELAKLGKLDSPISKIAKHISSIHEGEKAEGLLKEFEGKRNPMVAVVDKDKTVVGILTLEDILEAIVGEIFDKTKKHHHVLIKRIDSNQLEVGAKVSVEEINEILHLHLKEEHFDTLAKFAEHKLGKTPHRRDVIELRNVKLEVEEVENKHIKTIKVVKK